MLLCCGKALFDVWVHGARFLEEFWLRKLGLPETNLINGSQHSEALFGVVLNQSEPYTHFGGASCISNQLVWAAMVFKAGMSAAGFERIRANPGYIP